MSVNTDYLNYLVNGGDFDSLPMPTGLMGLYLRELCIKIDNLPVPMVFKGTLGVGGTITELPTASVSNTGHVYKVITDGTYSGQSAIAGDEFISDGTEWLHIPSGNDPATLVDYDDTTTQLGASNVQQAIEKLNAKPSGAGADYSLNEVDTGVKWIDGKHVYRKVVSVTAPRVETDGTEVTSDVALDISVDTLIDIRGNCKNTSNNYIYPFQYTINGVTNNKIKAIKFLYNLNTNTLRLLNSNLSLNGATGYVILEYTKK